MIEADSTITENSMTLGDLVVGFRVLFKSKKEWRSAVVTRKSDEFVSLSVASPSGYSYRIRRQSNLSIKFDGDVPLIATRGDRWRESLSKYDPRW